MAKWLLAITPEAGWSAGAERAFQRWARSAVDARLLAAEMEWLDADLQREFTGQSRLPPFCAFLSVWAQDAFDPALLGGPPASKVTALLLREQPVFEHRVPTPAAGDRVKKTTLWRARPELSPERWRAQYCDHARLVPSVHASACRYRQNLIERAPSGFGYDAVSELWWPQPEQLLNHFYASPRARRQVAEDTEQFIDIPSATQVVTRHVALRGPGL